MSTSQKVYKKGEILFKDGDKIQNVIFIQSGSVNQCLIKGKKNIDITQLGANQVLGEGALNGVPQHSVGAIATTETKTVEVAIDVLKGQVEGAPPIIKMLIKSLIDRLKTMVTEVKSSKLANDSTPCPPEVVPQVFGALFYTLKSKSVKHEKEQKFTMEWAMLKSYCQRVFAQSPKRLEQVINILIKLKLANFEMGKLPEDPDGPDVITRAHFYNIDAIEAFFEFFQYYFYKPGKNEIIKYDDFACQMLEIFVEHGEKATPDRFGVVSLEFNHVAETIKDKMGLNLNNDHFTRLENKGVLCKRRAITGQGVRLEFEIKEYRNLLFSWKFLREIDKWNEKGFVDLDEKEERKPKNQGPACAECSASLTPAAKFCQECGAKVTAAA